MAALPLSATLDARLSRSLKPKLRNIRSLDLSRDTGADKD